MSLRAFGHAGPRDRVQGCLAWGWGGAMQGLVDYSNGQQDTTRWSRFEFRRGDILISTPPKCGTAWTQMLCGLLLFDSPAFPGSIDELSPWLDLTFRTEQDVFAQLDAQQHRRFIKTHTPLDGIPARDDVTYLVVGRDPRDAMVSFEYHFANVDFSKIAASFEAQGRLAELELSPPPEPPPSDPDANFRMFIDHDGVGMFAPTVQSVLHHLDTAWQQRTQSNIGMFHYADYQQDLVGEMERLTAVLGLSFTRERLAELAPEAGLDQMRSRASELAPEAPIYVDDRAFFRSGGSGEWANRGTEADHRRYQQRVEELVSPDLAAWAHQGRLATGVDPSA
jgi:Sulfotransferase domain